MILHRLNPHTTDYPAGRASNFLFQYQVLQYHVPISSLWSMQRSLCINTVTV